MICRETEAAQHWVPTTCTHTTVAGLTGTAMVSQTGHKGCGLCPQLRRNLLHKAVLSYHIALKRQGLLVTRYLFYHNAA